MSLSIRAWRCINILWFGLYLLATIRYVYYRWQDEIQFRNAYSIAFGVVEALLLSHGLMAIIELLPVARIESAEEKQQRKAYYDSFSGVATQNNSTSSSSPTPPSAGASASSSSKPTLRLIAGQPVGNGTTMELTSVPVTALSLLSTAATTSTSGNTTGTTTTNTAAAAGDRQNQQSGSSQSGSTSSATTAATAAAELSSRSPARAPITPPPAPAANSTIPISSIDILIPCYKEEFDVIMSAVQCAIGTADEISYQYKQQNRNLRVAITLLDDGERQELRNAILELRRPNVHYHTRRPHLHSKVCIYIYAWLLIFDSLL